MTLEKKFVTFTNRHFKGGKPLLLGLSGGPDSLALFYLLLKYQIPFEVAHVDHGWRAESGHEALILKDLAIQYQLPFHEKKLKGKLSELACREERIQFFKDLYHQYQYQALVLGHQRDDQVETVFKRILEGASLTNLKGMGEASTFNGLPVWRPLIHVEKQEILQWLQNQNIKPFFDFTNEDPKYLRSRMRSIILPNLSATFGKEIYPSLIHIGEEARELHLFLEKHLDPIIQSIERSPSGYFLDLSTLTELTPFELKYLVRTFSKMGGLIASRNFVEKAAELIQKGVANKVLISGTYHLYIDRGRLFLYPQPLKTILSEYKPLLDNTFFNGWKISVKQVATPNGIKTDWKSAWKGEMRVTIPKGNYTLGPSKTPKLSKLWNNHKVPSFLGQTIPAIWHENTLIHEFLTGKIPFSKGDSTAWFDIEISMSNP
jgi:tRNA(Ile)-lysidine synthase